ncbi:MAG: hypothetical protein HYY34_00965 [Chloroflexi bacterium]|nr:hypothetical protein [Chloroflexota bacterium]
MDLTFERGDPARPKGHAIVYVRDAADRDSIAATYVIILPVTVDITKYVPPFLAQQVPNLGEKGLTAFAFPPAPEKVAGHEHVARLAEDRDDDLIFAGTRESIDPGLLMALVGEIVAEYSARYEKWTAVAGQPVIDKPGEHPGGGEVDEVVYALMSEADRLNELTKLVGRLRYAAEGGDSATVDEAESQIRGIAKQMPANRRIDRLLAAAHSKPPEGARLAQLYLERAYCLFREDYLRVKALDAEIAAMEPRPT